MSPRAKHALPAFADMVLSVARSFCGAGIVLGTLFFAAALTPTLIPRSATNQGALAGLCFAIGYGCGVLWRALWHYLGLPEASGRVRSLINAALTALSLAVVTAAIWQAAAGQNSIRILMEMDPVDTAHPFRLCVVALAVFAGVLVLGRLFGLFARLIIARAKPFVPTRLAYVLGVTFTVLIFWVVATNVVARSVLRMLDASFSKYDALFEPDRRRPEDPSKTGGADSLIRWDELGRTGRRFIASGPTAEQIGAVSGRVAREPIRVYVGLRGADTARERAQLALAELRRQGGFDRSALVVVTPTGTGWIDPSAMDSVEYLHEGDIASVAIQYSYLNSPLSLLVEPDYGSEAARALFNVIYSYWTMLPKDQRPRLYLHGLSLGAMHSERSVELFDIIGDPIAGALWSGPPFSSRLWRSLTENRNAGSPHWLPEFRDGRFARFMNQNGFTVPHETPWGPMRVTYLQYASDAITFFDYRDLYRRPEWMNLPRGPDVSSTMRWYPVVTMLQLALDMMVANKTPMGYGHVYAPEHYVDAWVAVMAAQTLPADTVVALKHHLATLARRRITSGAGSGDAYDDRGG